MDYFPLNSLLIISMQETLNFTSDLASVVMKTTNRPYSPPKGETGM